MEVWKWKLVTGNTQLTNDITFIKTLIYDHSSASSVVIYDEASGGTTTEFMTIHNTAEELTKPIILKNAAQLENGCYVVPAAGRLWVQYREG